MAFLAYKANECFNHQYIKIPKDLFINPLYKHLNSDSKIIYGFLLDRLSLSIKNNWIDEKTGKSKQIVKTLGSAYKTKGI